MGKCGRCKEVQYGDFQERSLDRMLSLERGIKKTKRRDTVRPELGRTMKRRARSLNLMWK